MKADGTTALMQAVIGNNPEIVDLLFSTFPGVDGSVKGANGSAMDLAIALDRDPRIINILQEKTGESRRQHLSKNRKKSIVVRTDAAVIESEEHQGDADE
jgi:hypothetical protein